MRQPRLAPWRPYREGETKPELNAIRKELEEKRVVDPNAKWTPYWPGETDADVRRIAQERQLQKELAANKGVKTGVTIFPYVMGMLVAISLFRNN